MVSEVKDGRGDDRAARALRQAHLGRRQLVALDTDIAPRTRESAYRVQAQGAGLTADAIAGWKIAATSEAGRRHINVDGPMAGRIVRQRVYHDGDTVPLADNVMRLAEIEFVFVMDATLPAREATYSDADVAAAVGGLRLGIELPSTRYVDPTCVGELQLIADNACAGDFVMGPLASDHWRETDLAATVVAVDIAASTGPRRAEGIGSAVLGHPARALTWLVNELSRHSIDLEAGQFVTTGTCCAPVPIGPGDHITAHFDGLGSVECAFH